MIPTRQAVPSSGGINCSRNNCSLLSPLAPSSTTLEHRAERPYLDRRATKAEIAAPNNTGESQHGTPYLVRDLQEGKGSTHGPIRSSSKTNTDLLRELNLFQQKAVSMGFDDCKTMPFRRNSSLAIDPITLQGDDLNQRWSLTIDEVRSLFLQSMMARGRELHARVVSGNGSQVLCDACSARISPCCSSAKAPSASDYWDRANDGWSLSDNDEELLVDDWSELEIDEGDAATTVLIGEDDMLDCANFDW